MLSNDVAGPFSSLYAVSARCDGVGTFAPVCAIFFVPEAPRSAEAAVIVLQNGAVWKELRMVNTDIKVRGNGTPGALRRLTVFL